MSVCRRDRCESNQPISLKHRVTIEPTSKKNCLTFHGDLLPDMDTASLFRFPHHCRRGHFRRVAFLIQSSAIFHKSCKMTGVIKGMNALHFGSDPVITYI